MVNFPFCHLAFVTTLHESSCPNGQGFDLCQSESTGAVQPVQLKREEHIATRFEVATRDDWKRQQRESIMRALQQSGGKVSATESTSADAGADGASNLFAQIFGPQGGHVRLVYGVQSLPIGAPLIVDVIFEIEPVT